MPNPPLFSTTNFNFPDTYDDGMQEAYTHCNHLASIFSGDLLDGTGITPEKMFGQEAGKISQSLDTMWNIIDKYHSPEGIMNMNFKDRETFRECSGKAMSFIRNYVNTNKTNVDNLSDEERNVFQSISESLDAIDKNQPHLDSMMKGLELMQKYNNEVGSAEDEKLMKELPGKFGPVGHKPTIDECLNMTPDNTDMDTVIDRMLWLQNNFMYHEDEQYLKEEVIASGEKPIIEDNTIYGYALRRLQDYCFSMSFDKQAEFTITMNRLRTGWNDIIDTEYKKIQNDIKDDELYHDPEMELLAAKEMLKQPKNAALKQIIEAKYQDPQRDQVILDTMKRFPGFNKVLKDTAKENLSMMRLSQTDSYRSNSLVENVLSTVNGQGRGQQLRSVFISHNVQTVLQSRPSNYIGDLTTTDMPKVQAQFRDSQVKERRDLWMTNNRTAQENGAKKVREVAESFSKSDEAMAEAYHNVMNDRRKSSLYFTNLRDSLKPVFSADPANINDPEKLVKLYQDIRKAREAVKQYQDKRKGFHLTKQGDERYAWAEQLGKGMENLEKTVTQRYADVWKSRTGEAAKFMKKGLDSLNDPNPDNRPADPEGMLKTCYARIIFYNSCNDPGRIGGMEEKAFHKFLHSRTLNAAFGQKSLSDLRAFAEKPTPAKIEAEINNLKKINAVITNNNSKKLTGESPSRQNTAGQKKQIQHKNNGPSI